MEQSTACEEGGNCQYRQPRSVGCCGWTYRICCCPCWVLFSCALSQGAAGASLQGLHGSGEDEDGLTCFKCGLSPAESRALNEAKAQEMRGLPTGHAPHHFTSTTPMTLPNAPSPSAPHYPPHSPSSPPAEIDRYALRSQVQKSLAPPSPNPSTGRRSQEGNPAVAWVEQQRRSQLGQ